MAIVSTLAGGICGFVAFAFSLIVTNMTAFEALSLYAFVGTLTAVGLMATGVALRSTRAQTWHIDRSSFTAE